MLVVFQKSSKAELAQALGIATWYNDFRNEDFRYCVAREKAQEIIACRELGIPYVVIDRGHEESKILDANVDLRMLPVDTAIVRRCSPSAKLPKALQSYPQWITQSEMDRVTQWPDHVEQQDVFLKRFVISMERDFFSQYCLSGNMTFPVFMKTTEKSDFHQVVESPMQMNDLFISVDRARALYPHKRGVLEGLFSESVVLVNRQPDWYCPYRDQMIAGRLDLDTLEGGIIISEAMAIRREESHKGEYRGYFINGQLSSISTYLDYEHAPVPSEISQFATEFGHAHVGMAKAFVADFCMTDRGPVLIEMNDFGHSGRYVDNDPVALYQDLARHFGNPSFVLTKPLVDVPSLAKTENPGSPEDDGEIAIDFGHLAELIIKDDDRVTMKKTQEQNSVMTRFLEAEKNKQATAGGLESGASFK